MTEEVRKKILDWIYDEHMHHADSKVGKLPVKVQKNDEWIDLQPIDINVKSDCWDGDSPYINSLELEEFIKGLN